MIILRNDALLMIEPTQPATVPIQDVWTRRADGFLIGKDFYWKEGQRYRGSYTCVCGATSQCFEMITRQGRLTNSLLAHYIACHRVEIPTQELIKLYAEYMDWSLVKAEQNFVIENEAIQSMTSRIDQAIVKRLA